MKERNRFGKYMAVLTASALCISAGLQPVHAEEDYSDESAWYARCTKVQTTQEDVNACEGFQEYQRNKRADLQAQVSAFSQSINDLNGNMEQVSALAQQQRELADQLQVQIDNEQAAIDELSANITSTEEEIAQRQIEIDEWDNQIKSRMRKEQAATGTNSIVDVLMGSSSLADLLRRLSGLERITENDQDQIEELNRMKQQLEDTKAQLEGLRQQHEESQAQLEADRQTAEELEASYQSLVAQYQQQVAEIEAAMRQAEADMEAIRDFTIRVDLSQDYSGVPSVGGFISPVPGARISAGTWAYPGGGIHLGLDMAASIGSSLVAPAGGIVIYASNTQGTNSGYLGNMSGFPYGSGNCIAMLCEVGGTLYCVYFFHLSNQFAVSAGSVVNQGDFLAQTGNSGNTSGPHTHVEVINLGTMSMSDAIAQFASRGDVSFGAGWGSGNRACDAGYGAPCRERPEKFF